MNLFWCGWKKRGKNAWEIKWFKVNVPWAEVSEREKGKRIVGERKEEWYYRYIVLCIKSERGEVKGSCHAVVEKARHTRSSIQTWRIWEALLDKGKVSKTERKHRPLYCTHCIYKKYRQIFAVCQRPRNTGQWSFPFFFFINNKNVQRF